MKQSLIAIPLLMLIGCSEAEQPAPAEEEAVETETPAVDEPNIALAGSWDITGWRNAPLAKDMSVTADGGSFTVRSNCATMVWSYTVDGNLVSFTPVAGTDSGCAARSDGFENGVAETVSRANIVMEMNGGVQLSGAGGSLDLMPRG